MGLMMRLKRTVFGMGVVSAVAAVTLGLSGCAPSVQFPDTLKVQSEDSTDGKITVTGQEEVRTVPDMAQIEYSIHTKKDTAAECQEQNNKDLNAAVQTLKSLGMEEKSIQTSSVGLNPVYDWNSPNQEITGYEMTTHLTLSNVPIDKAGDIMSESVAAGVNSIDSVSYFSSNYDASYQEALKGAMGAAKAKAEALAEACGKSITGVSHVQEYGYNPDIRNTAYVGANAGKPDNMAAGADMTVMPGEVSVKAQVTVDFEIN